MKLEDLQLVIFLPHQAVTFAAHLSAAPAPRFLLFVLKYK